MSDLDINKPHPFPDDFTALDLCVERNKVLLAENERLRGVMQFVVDRYTNGCEVFRAPSTCLTAGRTRDAEYGADQWCDACVLREALKEK